MRALGPMKIMASVIVLAAALVITVGYERDENAHSRDEQLQFDVDAEADRLDEYFERARSVVRLTARNPAFRDFYREPGTREDRLLSSIAPLADANEALRYLNVLYTDSIGEACFIDATGPENARSVRGESAAIADLSPDERGASFFGPTFALEYGDVYQAEPYISDDTGEWVVSNSTLVPLPNGDKQAIVHFEITIDSFGRVAMSSGSDLRIVDIGGRVVTDSRVRQLKGRGLGRPEQTQFVGLFSADGPSSGVVSVGTERIAYQRVGRGDNNANVWFAVASIPVSSSFLDGFGVRSFAILSLGLALLLLELATSSYHRRLRAQATTDDLTGLPNRLCFHDRAGQALSLARRQGLPLAIMLIDIDQFKDINDTLGHHRGDELLRDVGRRLQAAVRDSDTVSRIGGDEFAVVLTETDGAIGAIGAAERLSSEAFSTQQLIAGVPVNVRASIGIALFPDHGRSVAELLQHADVAMYHAKRHRLPHCLYDTVLDPNSPGRLAIISELRNGIANDELVLHYQPKFDITNLRLVGVEALVRWNHPQNGLLAPGEFLKVAESAQLIPALTRSVMKQASEQQQRWQRGGRDLTVAVNISPQSLSDASFLDDVRDVIADTGIDPRGLVFEITEDSLLRDPEQAIEVLNVLREMGLKISLDDFGTGFSSLTYLRRLPVDEIKIDRSFIYGLADNTVDQAIVRSTIELCHSLGQIVTAEGVEDTGALQRLREMGCDLAQGFLLGRPVPADQLTALLGPSITSTVRATFT